MIYLNKEKNFVDDYVVFDLETTGLDPLTTRIIEIGALKYHNNELVDEFSALINPETVIPEVITKITGLAKSDLEDKPTIKEVMPEFLNFIGDLPLVAHNSSFDLSFIEANLKRLGMPVISNTNIDTIEIAKIYIPKAYNYKLETLKKYFKLDYGSHRSVDDCKTTNYVYQYCKKKSLVTN